MIYLQPKNLFYQYLRLCFSLLTVLTHLLCLRQPCPAPVSIQLLLGSAKGVEPVDMDIFGLREAEDTSNRLLLKGLGLGKGHSTDLGHICWTVRMDDDDMVGNFKIGPYTYKKITCTMSCILYYNF